MRLSLKREILPAALFLTMMIGVFHFNTVLSGKLATHFDLHGNPNGWMDKGSFFLSSAAQFLFIYLLLTFLPFIDPLRKKVETRYGVILVFRDAALIFSNAAFFIVLYAAEAGRQRTTLPSMIIGILGLLLIVFGNYLPKVPQNWFFGIRTPWSLSSDIVWKKTNIVGGWLLMLSGIVCIVSAVLKLNSLISLVFLFAVLIVAYI